MAITYTETIMMDDFPSDGADMYYTFTVPNGGNILTAEVELFIGGDLASSTEYGRAYIDGVQIGGDLNGNNSDSDVMTSEGVFNILTHLSGKASVELHGYSSTATDVGYNFPDTSIKLEWRFTITYEEPSTSSGLNLYYKINSEYKNIINSYTKVSGSWKNIVSGFTKINGEWKSLGSAYIAPPGQIEWTTPGTYSWVVPEGVTSISAVAVGGGGASGSSGSNYSGGGGGGGGLAWATSIVVTPLETLAITVGAGGENPSGDGRTSMIRRVMTPLLSASGGKGGSSTNSNGIVLGTGGTVLVGDGGGTGGTGGQTGYNTAGGGGGGAGGYTGNGGDGGYGNSGTQATPGTGGGGGGGNPSGTAGAYGGGGVGIYGQGANGAVNSGGSGGGNPSIAASSGQVTGGLFGGGGGAEEDDTSITGTKGGGGAVRIIWGEGRAYPSTNTADV